MLHSTQTKILKLAQRADLKGIGYRKLGKLIGVGEDSPQKIRHHLEQLERKGFIRRNKKTGDIEVLKPVKAQHKNFFNLPIVGSADCGPANVLANENIEGYLQVSSSMLGSKNPEGLFVLKAAGDSLNRAKKVKGGEIESGDYVVIDSKKRDPKDGDYILSVIDDCANLKRFYKDKKTGQIALVSESKTDIPPIYIHPSDYSNYMVNGEIARVIKKP